MATYKGIQGYSVQTLASDPSPTASVEGQLWFNSTSSTYKIAVAGAGAWSSGGTLNNTTSVQSGAGTQTATLSIAGISPAGEGSNKTETYNGTAWTEVADTNTLKYAGMG